MVAVSALGAEEKRVRFAAVRELLASRGMLVPAARERDLDLEDGLEGDGPAPEPDAIATGHAPLDGLLPGGFPRRAVTEIAGAVACGKTSLVAAALAGLTRGRRMAAWIDPAGEAYPPAFAGAGVVLSRMLWVRAPLAESLWAAEVLLQSGTFDAVVLDATALPPPARGAEAAARERRTVVLRAAAEAHGVALVVLSEEAPVFGAGAPPSVKLRVKSLRGEAGARAVEVEVERSRYGGVGRRARVEISGSASWGSPRQAIPSPPADDHDRARSRAEPS